MKKSFLILSLLLIQGFDAQAFAQHHDASYVNLNGRVPSMDFTTPANIPNNSDFTLTMTLYDRNSNKKFEHVSVQLAVFQEGSKNPVMNALFYDKTGEIVIDFVYKSFDKPKVEIRSPQETFLGGYMGEYGSHIKISQNIFSQTGSYVLEATVISVDNPRALLDPPIKFTKEINVGTNIQADDQKVEIPSWVKNNAKWWSEGSIGDRDFASGIQFMLKNKIITIPATKSGETNKNIEIPSWVKNNAKWWSEGSIGDKDFVMGIQYLVRAGIIQV